MRRRYLAVIAVVSALAAGTLSAQNPTTQTSGGGSADAVISPAVVASWLTRGSGPGPTSLELLVLWRGTPGWFLQGSSHGSSSSGNAAGRTVITMHRAGLDLELVFTPEPRTVTILGKDIPLGGANVLLVDHVDGPAGPAVIGTRTVDPALSSLEHIEEALRRSSDAVEFLRCDVQLPDANVQAMMRILCTRFAGK